MKKSPRIGERDKIKIAQEIPPRPTALVLAYPPVLSLETSPPWDPSVDPYRSQVLGEGRNPRRVLVALERGDCEPFFQALRYDPTILTISPIYWLTIDKWWKQKLYANEAGEQARQLLKRIGSVLADPLGRPELPPKEREAIAADCLKWRPICEGLNNAFKTLWKQPEYESSEPYRKEARGLLAEKYSISVKEVKTIERVLKAPARRGNKSTPTEAMLQMVALSHVNRDAKTVEKIWGDYLKDHPEESRRKRKLPTTPVAERTA